LIEFLSIRESVKTYPLGIERVFTVQLYLFYDKCATIYLT